MKYNLFSKPPTGKKSILENKTLGQEWDHSGPKVSFKLMQTELPIFHVNY